MAQGRFFEEAEIERIVSLLASTEMTIGEIAERMCCSRGAVVAINRKRQVRNYGGHRNKWKTFTETPTEIKREVTGICTDATELGLKTQ